MTLQEIKKRLESQSIFFSEDAINNWPAVIGYDKRFKWRWLATQMNTFLVAVDCGSNLVDVTTIEAVLAESFEYASRNYNGWPRGMQSGIGVITILISSKIEESAIEYCHKLKSGKKWAGFTVPVVLNSSTNQVYFFKRNPVWGRVYYPHFKSLIEMATQ
jgi:hypothetical protein